MPDGKCTYNVVVKFCHARMGTSGALFSQAPQQQQQHPFNGPLFGTTGWVSQYQKGKTNQDFLE